MNVNLRGPSRAELFAAALVELDAELDWEGLGRLYCSEGGEHFFGPEDRAAWRESSLLFAGDVGEAVSHSRGGCAVYVGAALAELAPVLCESLVLERQVWPVNLPGPEADEIDRALRRVAARLKVELPRMWTAPLHELPRGQCDHGWMVSVLTDPDAFPALHDHLYDRHGAEATGCGDLDAERRKAETLVHALLDRLRIPAWLTTTDEELSIVERACHRRGWRLRVPRRARLSPIVGDPVRLCELRAAA